MKHIIAIFAATAVLSPIFAGAQAELPKATSIPDSAEEEEDEGDGPAAASGSFSFGKSKPTDNVVVEVVATGHGANVDAAHKDAVRNAIKSVVGELVDAKTLVENDELVEDKILTLSNAVVEKAVRIGQPIVTENGLLEVKINAFVKKGQLNHELEKIGISRGAVAGKTLINTSFTKKERIENAEEFLAERFAGFPQNVVEAVVLTKQDGTPDIEFDEPTGHAYANVGIRVNMENYTKWTQALQELLGKMCLDQEQTTLILEESKGYNRPDYRYAEITNLKRFPKSKVFSPSQMKEGMANLLTPPTIIVATPRAGKLKRNSWPITIYYFDSEVWNTIAKVFESQRPFDARLSVSLVDGDGDPVCSQEYKSRYDNGSLILNEFGFITPYGFKNINIVMDSYLCIVPNLGVSFYSGPPIKINCLKDPTLKKRIDIGKVDADDIAESAGYEVQIKYLVR